MKNAMLFAAGLGTRLRPLTHDKPKALVPILGKPLLGYNIERLIDFGFRRIVVNVHHFADKVEAYLNSHTWEADVIISDERDILLETGGGIYYAKKYFQDDDFLMYNVDVISNIDLYALLDFHKKNKPLVTLATRSRPSTRQLLFDENQQLCGRLDSKNNLLEINPRFSLEKLTQYGFSGIHVASPRIFEYLKEGKYSIMDTYINIMSQEKILAYPHHENYWFDVGTLEKLAIAEQFLDSLKKT